ncbi:hypothetical protein [Kribbella shirazensis]|uniref:Uncharacterized protein n=1 Tax=Kribbella shirazensis TaxID=1105143 RepID=A0A7X5VID7_9ACTN|nr:hypothetical protein [Kribbella shirazensis]NIK61351.1 hypothetical protein [Kribbella shirazensis]
MKMISRTLRVVVGVAVLVIGGCLAAAGGVLTATTGPDDTMRTAYHPVTATSRALVARAANVSPGAVPGSFGEFTLRIDARANDEPLFVGVAPASAAESYLSGAAVQTVRRLDLWPYRLQTADTPGTARPLRPERQSFWAASASGPSPQLTWSVTDGEYRVVIMNTDASPGLDTEVRYALTMPWLFEIGLGSLALGGLLTVSGVFVILRARRKTA